MKRTRDGTHVHTCPDCRRKWRHVLATCVRPRRLACGCVLSDKEILARAAAEATP